MPLEDIAERVEEKLEETLDAIELILGGFLEILQEAWDVALATANPGQAEVIVTMILTKLTEYMDGVAEAWPNIEFDEYSETMYFDTGNPEMRQRAFSDTIEGDNEQLQGLVDTAQALDAVASSLWDKLMQLLSAQ